MVKELIFFTNRVHQLLHINRHMFFSSTPKKYLYKILFLGTKLGEILQTMSFTKSVPKGLKLSENKRGVGDKNSPIWYIPKKDPVQEALEKSKKTNCFKLTLPSMGSKLKVALWASGTPKQFILHVHSAIHACKQMEHDVKYLNAKEAVSMERRTKGIQRRCTCCLRVPSSCQDILR
jgi:hypothetical protein